MSDFEKARALLREFKGDAYVYGPGILSEIGPIVARLGTRPALVRSTFPGSDRFVAQIHESMKQAGLRPVAEIRGARPNAPREDLFRITDELKAADPDVIVCFGAGSTIDATKAAEVLRTLDGKIDDYFGTGLVTQALKQQGKTLTPIVAIQSAASSAAHLTKYSNITDVRTAQKKLIVDEAIVPPRPAFEYEATYLAPRSLTADGAMDGHSHCLEVLYNAVGKSYYPKVAEIARVGIRLILRYLPRALENPQDKEAREALCLATDLGGYCIMIGGTSGGHLTSFSLVDILPHGRACALMNPYYTVFYAPAIEAPLRLVGQLYQEAGILKKDISSLKGRDLGIAVAEAMLEFNRRVGIPIALQEVPGFSESHITRAITAAKDPQLRMKLENMPVPLTPEMVDEYMGSVLEAAKVGDLTLVKNVQ